mgnify:CR=1 FL=1
MIIPSKYDPQNTEEKWYSFWMEKGFFRSIPDGREPYCIVIPPPNVTGVLHMGHMLNNTIQDVLARRARMQGKNTLWLPGTDHASIATEAKVVAKLKEEGIDKVNISREKFLEYAWEWKEKHGGIILEQLKKLGSQLGIPVHDTDKNRKPEDTCQEALARAGTAGADILIMDTAGRLHIDDALMAELVRIKERVNPTEILLVADAMTGQDAVNVARGFLERTELTGLIFSKLDGDARGGAAISAREVTGRPIKFAGVGEGLDGLEVFHPERMASRLLGMGDVLTLIEKAEAAWDREQAEAAAEKMLSAAFTFEDFLDQLQQVRRMGSLGQLLGMLPGAASALGAAEVSDEALSRAEAIIRSMTPGERRSPKLIDGSRRRRIAAGSGTSPQQVNELLRQFGESQRMMKAFAEGRSPIPGLALPGRKLMKKKR